MIDEPQVTSKDLSSILKRDRVIDSELICKAACTMCDFWLMTKKDDCIVGTSSPSSDEELESESDDDEELSSFDFKGSCDCIFVSTVVED